MSKYEPPKPRQFTASQEREHRDHETRIDYVAAHRDEFLLLVTAAHDDEGYTLQCVVTAIGQGAHLCGRSFDETLYAFWRNAYHPFAVAWDFDRCPIDFDSCLKVMRVALPVQPSKEAHECNPSVL